MKKSIKGLLVALGLMPLARKIRSTLSGAPRTETDEIPKSFIKGFLPPNPVIIDAGAHKGYDSIEMAEVWPGASIHAFEPVPAIYQQLEANTKGHSAIRLYKLALSSRTGEDFIHVSSGESDASSSLLKPKDHVKDHPDVHFEQKIPVQTITLDDWAAKFDIQQVDFLWLDMQGYELEVLKASTVILPKVKVIHMEVSTRETYESVPLYTEVKEWLHGKGFTVQREAIPPGWDMGNILFVRN